MERIIASFRPDKYAIGSNHNQENIGEIVIDGDSIEYYLRENSNPFVNAYIGYDGQYAYTVYVNGSEYAGVNRTLSYAHCYKVLCVLKSAKIHEFPIDKEIVTEVSFTIPELIPWINMKTVTYNQVSMTEAVGKEENIEDLDLLNDEESDVRFVFSSKTCKNARDNGSVTSITVEKIPEINIKYRHPVSLERVRSDSGSGIDHFHSTDYCS